MGTDDRFKNRGRIFKGRFKEAAGKVTDNERLEAEGKGDQVRGKLGQAAESVKDAFRTVFGRRRRRVADRPDVDRKPPPSAI